MKKLLIILAILVSTGCAIKSKPEQINKIMSLCNKNDGISYVWLAPLGTSEIVCNDGAMFYYTIVRE